MAYLMTTPLGREVPVGDWKAYGRDQILRLLYDFAQVPFNDGTLVYGLAAICNAARLDMGQAMELTRDLVAQGYAEEPSTGNFRITLSGMQVVHGLGSRVWDSP